MSQMKCWIQKNKWKLLKDLTVKTSRGGHERVKEKTEKNQKEKMEKKVWTLIAHANG